MNADNASFCYNINGMQILLLVVAYLFRHWLLQATVPIMADIAFFLLGIENIGGHTYTRCPAYTLAPAKQLMQ